MTVRTMTATPLLALADRQWLRVWWPLLAGLALMYLPTFYDLGTGLWTTEGYAHGPIILVLALWLLGRQWPPMWAATDGRGGSPAAWAGVVLALLMYILGRAQDILMFELGSF